MPCARHAHAHFYAEAVGTSSGKRTCEAYRQFTRVTPFKARRASVIQQPPPSVNVQSQSHDNSEVACDAAAPATTPPPPQVTIQSTPHQATYHLIAVITRICGHVMLMLIQQASVQSQPALSHVPQHTNLALGSQQPRKPKGVSFAPLPTPWRRGTHSSTC